MNARFRHHGRLRVEGVLDFVTLLRNCEKVRIGQNLDRIAWFLGAHPPANRSIVITVKDREHQDERENESLKE